MRKSIEYLMEEGADKGKVFVITRMSAFAADEWAADVMQALTKASTNFNTQSSKFGIAGLEKFSLGLFAYFDKEDRKKAYESLLKCCQIKRDPRNPLVEPTKILEVDIEDPMTLTQLRHKAFSLHVDFLKAAASQIFLYVAAMIQEEDSGKEKA